MGQHLKTSMARRDFRRPASVRRPIRRQRGVSLFIVMIALVVLMTGGIALLRSIDTGVLLSGNLAYRQAAVQAADLGIETAVLGLPANYDNNVAGKYFALTDLDLKLDSDAKGVRLGIDWSNAYSVAAPTALSGYTINYIVERLCKEQTVGSTTVTDVVTYCVTDEPKSDATMKAGAIRFSSSTAVYYRITVRVAGPKNTVSIVQAFVKR